MSEITVSSCCKINLFLQVTGRQSNGYHTLQTLFLPVKGLADTINCDFRSAVGIEVCVHQPELPSGKDNIIYRAAEMYAEAAKTVPTWKFTLDKNIPVAAGLGGGSSNAAAVLNALNSKYKALDSRMLHETALKIGADVPFFLNSVPAWAGGVGERLEVLNQHREPLHVVLVNPGFPVGVRWAYGKLDAERFQNADIEIRETLTYALACHDVQKIASLCRNDLGTALFVKFPLLAILKNSMLEAGAVCVQISGSGPTLFAVCSSKKSCAKVAEKIRNDFKNNSGIRVFECEV